MMTVITRVTLEQGTEPEWDEAMRDRMETARSVEGWISGQILMPLYSPNDRVIVGVWETRAAWESWHEDPTFRETRERLERIGADDGDTVWHEVVYDAR
jgi:heme-degrading monooxygenase HmoA